MHPSRAQHLSIDFLRLAVCLAILNCIDAYNGRKGSHQSRPDHLHLVLLAIETMPQPYRPLDVEIRANAGHEVPATS